MVDTASFKQFARQRGLQIAERQRLVAQAVAVLEQQDAVGVEAAETVIVGVDAFRPLPVSEREAVLEERHELHAAHVVGQREQQDVEVTVHETSEFARHRQLCREQSVACFVRVNDKPADGVTPMIAPLPLAVTSTRGWMRRLGKRWKKLHRLIYVIGILGVWHFYWQVKLDTLEALIYAGILIALFAFRLLDWQRRRRKGMAGPRSHDDRIAHPR